MYSCRFCGYFCFATLTQLDPTRGRKQAPARIIIRFVADAVLDHGDRELLLEITSAISC
jgi:hypothetical protein